MLTTTQAAQAHQTDTLAEHDTRQGGNLVVFFKFPTGILELYKVTCFFFFRVV